MKKSIKKITVKKASHGYSSAAKASGLSGGTKTTSMQSGGKITSVKKKGSTVTKKVVKVSPKKPINPADSYPANKDKRGVPTIGGGEGTNPPFPNGREKGTPYTKTTYGGAKNGGTMGKCRGGCN